MCVNDIAYISAANSAATAILARGVTELAINVALSTWRRNVARDINDMKEEIANRQVVLAEAAHAHASGFYPAEAALVGSAMGIPISSPEYSLANGWTVYASEANTYGRASWLKAARALCMVPTRCDDGRWSNMLQKNEVDIGNFAMRQAENRSQALNDVRYKHQLDVLALGHGRLASSAGYSQAAGTIASNVSDAIMGSVNSAASLVGYVMNRQAIRPQWEYGYSPQVAQTQAVRQPVNLRWENGQPINSGVVNAYLNAPEEPTSWGREDRR